MSRRAKLITVLITTVILLAMASGGAFYTYRHYQNLPVYLDGTTLNGEDISGRTPDQVADRIAREYADRDVPVILFEGSESVLDGVLSQFGYTFEKEPVLAQLQELFAEQHASPSSIWHALREGDAFTIATAFSYDETVLRDRVQVANLSVPRTGTVDPSIAFNEETQRYYVVPGTRGDEIDDAAMQELMKMKLDEAVKEEPFPEYISITLTPEVYCSPEPADNIDELEAECLSRNKEVVRETWKDTAVVYTFGSETETLDYDTIKDWLLIDDDLDVTLDDGKAADWVADLAARYNTLYHDRTFTSSTGRTITIPGDQNGYGYVILQEQELAQLSEELMAKQSVTREPVYLQTNDWGNPYYLARNGHDDLCGTYVDIDLTSQHLWFYKNGQLVIETDIISGTPDGKHDTKTGALPLAYKESPSVLRGEQADGNYEVKVQYWMAFYEGQGLHDASWQSSFGGNAYLSSGSHGCINLPPAAAKTIYENIDEGTALLIYK